ncbi:MAG: aminoacetone oxidase family FAD-binding enzyme [Candidatus Ornithospirochaeta sp.]|nr:aminoacetone oxidase family FAD-binding enzyme [Candidatus Ornithospirochaeta sp.]
MRNKADTLIIGGGASGLMAGAILGSRALVLESNDEAGRKLLLTGGGRCNFTHNSAPLELLRHYYEAKNFVRYPLYAFTPIDIISFFDSIGVPSYTDDDNRVYPVTDSSSDVVSALVRRCRIAKGKALSIEKSESIFRIRTEDSEYEAGNVILAAGGSSYPHTGSDGNGYRLAKALGHRIEPVRPALAPIIFQEPLKGAMGITIDARLKKGRNEAEGSIVITGNGISGPAAENLSRHFCGKEEIVVSFLDITPEEIKAMNGRTMLRNALPLPERLTSALVGEIAEKRIADLRKEELRIISERLSGYRTPAWAGSNGAMSSRGGVDRREIDSRTMESKLVKGLYFAGDIVDVDAECGGYSLTWAFASAKTAACSINESAPMLL